jgi:hypothetical protein
MAAFAVNNVIFTGLNHQFGVLARDFQIGDGGIAFFGPTYGQWRFSDVDPALPSPYLDQECRFAGV